MSEFNAESRLTALEVRLVQAVERGKMFKPSPTDIRRSRLRGGLIRAILLGTPLQHHPRAGPGKEPVAVAMTAHGIRLIATTDKEPDELVPSGPRKFPPLLRIAGLIDLRGLGAPGGGFLPPLHLEGCLFDSAINLSGAQLQSLKLVSSRFSRLAAVNSRFSGSVLVRDCAPRADAEEASEREFLERTIVAEHGSTDKYRYEVRAGPAWQPGTCPCALCAATPDARDEVPYEPYTQCCNFCCEIDFEAAEIGGSLEVSRTYLRAGRIVGRRYVTPKITDRFAAYLDGVKVGGSIVLERSIFVGRCSVRSATVTNDLWVHGGKFIGSAYRATFDFQLSSIGGLLVFRTHEATMREEQELKVRGFPVLVVGHISGISLQAGEVWIAEGFYFGHDSLRRGGYATINFGKADIGRTFKVGTYHEFQDAERPSGPAWIQGEICLTAANLGKNLEVHGVDYEGIFETAGLELSFYRYFGAERKTPHLRLSGHGIKIDRRAYISKGRFRDIDALPRGSRRSRKPSAVDFWKSTIGTGFRMERESSCIGAIRLNSCLIGRETIIRCSKIEESPYESARRLRQGRIPTLIDISESTVDGHVKIGRGVLRRRSRASDEHSASAVRRAQETSDTAVRVEGAISLRSSQVAGGILLGYVTVDLSRDLATPSVVAGGGERIGRPVAAKASNPVADVREPIQLRKSADEEDDRIAIDLRGCDCGSDLEIRGMQWKLPAPRGREVPTRAKGWWKSESKAFCIFGTLGRPFGLARFRQIHSGFFAIVDLRGFRCATLLDGFGADWGLLYRIQLRIAGIRIEDVEPICHRGPGPSARPERDRLRWLAYQHTMQPAELPAPVGQDRRMPRIGFAERFAASWRDDFVPHALQVFSSAYRRAGEDLTADRILVGKKDTQNALIFWRLLRKWYAPRAEKVPIRMLQVAGLAAASGLSQHPDLVIDAHHRLVSLPLVLLLGGALALWPFVFASFQILFKWMFLYGLSAERGLFVFAASICVGWGVVHDWRHAGLDSAVTAGRPADGSLNPHIVLVLDVPPQPSAPPEKNGGSGSPDRVVTPALVAQPSPCDVEVGSFLYAIDTFLPLIDLDQERRCTIRSARPGQSGDPYMAYRVAKAFYELAGWLVTSLLILTVTGVLRRDLER